MSDLFIERMKERLIARSTETVHPPKHFLVSIIASSVTKTASPPLSRGLKL